MLRVNQGSIIAFLSFAFFGSAASLTRQTDLSKAQLYTFQITVHLIERGSDGSTPEAQKKRKSDDLAYRLDGEMLMTPVWSDHRLHSLLHIQIFSLNVLVKNKKNNETEFNKWKTNVLVSNKNDPFLVEKNDNRVDKIYLHHEEEIFIRNLKKAIATLFQFRTTHSHVKEMDVAGFCEVTYEVVDTKTILKSKKNCRSHLAKNQHSDPIFSSVVDAERKVLYQLTSDLKNIISVTSYETLDLKLNIKKEMGITVVDTIELNLKETTNSKIATLSNVSSVEEAINEINKMLSLKLQPDTLYLEEKLFSKNLVSIQKTLKENRQYLTVNQLGTYRSAVAFIEVLKVIQESSEGEIVDMLKNKKNEPILNQLMDILGSAETMTAHNAVMKTFDFIKPKNIEPLERYLWSVSVGKRPKRQFFHDLTEILKKNPADQKLKETILLTVASLSTKFSQEVIEEVHSLIINGANSCPNDDDKCVAMYLRAFRSLKDTKAKSILLHHAITGSRMLSVTALKVLYSLPSVWDEDVLKVAERIYYQKDKIYDSSARTIAVDIIIDSNPNEETLRYLLRSLRTNTSFEASKYLLQRLQQVASVNESFASVLNNLMKQENLLHYDALAQKGLSNALTRRIFEERDLTASIFTVNEVSKSVLKRCHVSVTLSQNNDSMKIASLDLFTGGLSYFLWSEEASGEEELDEAEDLIAGMELMIRGIHLRPFVFFSGHTELMGHIWAGTASERTSALQSMGLFQEHNEFIALSTGNIVKFNLMGSYSAELAGQIAFSIWNRNAHSVVESSVGAVIKGSTAIDTFFIKNSIDFNIYSENEVEITSDLDFYDEVLFCLQISQKKTVAKYEVEKEQFIPNTSHLIHSQKGGELILPGRTFYLNRKNNEMCNAILSRAR